METAEDSGFAILSISGWRQFETLALTFDRRLTVLTGANGSGKSTVLTLLARHFNWPRVYSTAPNAAKTRSESWSSLARHRARRAEERGEPVDLIGMLQYRNGISSGNPRALQQG